MIVTGLYFIASLYELGTLRFFPIIVVPSSFKEPSFHDSLLPAPWLSMWVQSCWINALGVQSLQAYRKRKNSTLWWSTQCWVSVVYFCYVFGYVFSAIEYKMWWTVAKFLAPWILIVQLTSVKLASVILLLVYETTSITVNYEDACVMCS